MRYNESLKISFESDRSNIQTIDTTSDLQTAIWQMYNTARAESIAAQQMMESVISWSMVAAGALVAGIGIIMQYLPRDPIRIQLIGWFFIGSIGMIGASEYMAQVWRMLRAGYFARQIEKRVLDTLGDALPPDLAWETFLSRRKGRLFLGYGFTGGSTIILLITSQFMPFLLYHLNQRVLMQYWWTLLVVGTIAIFSMCFIQFFVYKNRFPTRE